ncbi:MAG: GNAT family N-acetyltransferase [Candidatus Electryoneaceae bacterium]|nr:GNAT family N-acetyltransferase [Candidatus Electryoneaceae bacterium]
MNHIQYIEGNEDQLDLIGPLWEKLNEHHKAVSAHFSESFPHFNFRWRKTGLLEKVQGDDIRVDLAKDAENDRYIGYCLSTIVQNKYGVRGEIESLYVEPDYRNSGVGGILMKKALEWMDDRGVERKILGVAVGNEDTYDFYKGFGFFPRTTILQQITQ